MDFDYKPEEEKFRQQVHSFLVDEKAEETAGKEWALGKGLGPQCWALLRKLGAKGWLTPHWPKEYGGLGLSDVYRYIVMEEMEYFTGRGTLVAAGMAGPIVLRRGSPEQKADYLPRIARGEIEFALGYSEPEAGSDVSNIQIKAEDKGDYFLINGHKMFNSASHYSRYHWLGARTENTTPRYKGISLFIVDFQTPGITISPLYTMADFRTNEVVYDNVKVPRTCLVGEKNKGMYYIMEALDFERIYLISGIQKRFDHVLAHVKESGKGNDPLTRQKLAQIAIELKAARLFAFRVIAMLEKGSIPNYEAALLKCFATELEQRLINAEMHILGPYSQLKEGSKWAVIDGEAPYDYLKSTEDLVTRGTSEIMRNIIAQRGLGMPRA